MKKILLLAILAMAFTACSTDNESDSINEASLARKKEMQKTTGINIVGAVPVDTTPGSKNCWSVLTAHYDNVGTLSNPKWNFVAEIPQASAGNYKIVLEIQATDGEDITVGYGDIISITDDVVYNNINVEAPSVVRQPSQLLQWYRWRLRIYGLNGKNNNISCEQVTPWYDTPLG